MKIILVLLITISLYGASTKQTMLNFYQNGQYKDACHIGFRNFTKHRKDESYISLYAFSCLEADYIDRLSIQLHC
jgi:hypothetical protein